MTTTRRRKAPTRSVAIRRVKQNAKRKERKTQRRKSRNKVMRGGVHENLNVYVIQKLGKPKCFIIRQKTMTKDTIYLFFDSNLTVDEIKEFVCAAMGLDVDAVITPELISHKSTDNKFNSLFVKLSGTFSYSLSSGQLINYTQFYYFTQETLTEHTSKIAMKNGGEIIQSLESKMAKDDYRFMEVTDDKMLKSCFKTTYFCKNDLYKLFNVMNNS